MGCGCVFVWVEGFALIVGLLCACIVRRFWGLWRVCPYFFLFSSSSPIFLGFAFVVLGLSSCLFCLFLCACCFLFPFGICAKRKGAKCFASSLVLLWVCLDVIKHYRYFLRFIVTVSIPFTNDSCDRFRRFRWVVYNLPVVVNC